MMTMLRLALAAALGGQMAKDGPITAQTTARL